MDAYRVENGHGMSLTFIVEEGTLLGYRVTCHTCHDLMVVESNDLKIVTVKAMEHSEEQAPNRLEDYS